MESGCVKIQDLFKSHPESLIEYVTIQHRETSPQSSKDAGFVLLYEYGTPDTCSVLSQLSGCFPNRQAFLHTSHARYNGYKRLKHMSYTDALTGLPNRFALTDYITELIGKKEKFAAVSMDLNDFRHVNDTLSP